MRDQTPKPFPRRDDCGVIDVRAVRTIAPPLVVTVSDMNPNCSEKVMALAARAPKITPGVIRDSSRCVGDGDGFLHVRHVITSGVAETWAAMKGWRWAPLSKVSLGAL